MGMKIFIVGIVGFSIGYFVHYLIDKNIIADYNRLKLENKALKNMNEQYSKLNKILNIRIKKYKKSLKELE